MTFNAIPGEWGASSSYPAVVVEPSNVSVESCPEPEGATFTISEVRCGTIAFERNDAGPEIVVVQLEIECPDGSVNYPEFPSVCGQRREIELGAGTYAAHIDVGTEAIDGIGTDDIEVIDSPVTVSSCE